MSKNSVKWLGISRFAFQFGIGAIAISLVWGFLTTGEWKPERTDLIPLILFGLVLPWAVISIPAQIASSATASGRFLMLVSVLLALLALAMSLGRFFFSWDRIFVVVLAGSISSMGVIAQMIWARLWSLPVAGEGEVTHRDGVLSFGGWFAGITVAPLVGLLGGAESGFWIGAGALFASGWMIQFLPRKSTAESANWLSNRSALRLLSAIENAVRNQHSRMILFRVFWFAGAFFSLVALIPDGWTPAFGISIPSGAGAGANLTGLTVILLAAVVGMALGGSRKFAVIAENRPGLVLAFICLSAPAAALGVAILPAGANALPSLILGVGWGVVMGAASRELRKSLGRGFGMESEVLLLTTAGCGGLIFLACVWPAHEVFGFGPLLLMAEFLLFAGFAFVWRRSWIFRFDETESRNIDLWYPGKFDLKTGETGTAKMISVTYEIPEERRESFGTAIRELAHLRQKQGALYWTLTDAAVNPDCFTEQFIVESLADYQEAIRSETEKDRAIKQRVFDLNHWDSLPYETQSPLLEV